MLPEGFFSTSNLPTYVQWTARWLAPDAAADGLRRREARPAALETIEPRRLRRGDLVAMGEAEDGTEGIVVHAEGFLGGGHGANEFRFMSTEVSRERPVNYEELAARVGEEKRRGGYLVWVVGPGAGALARARGLRVVHPATATCRRCWPGTRSRCTTSRRPSSAPRSA